MMKVRLNLSGPREAIGGRVLAQCRRNALAERRTGCGPERLVPDSVNLVSRRGGGIEYCSLLQFSAFVFYGRRQCVFSDVPIATVK